MYSCVSVPLFPLTSGFFFFFNDTATTEIYTLSLHDALPICGACPKTRVGQNVATARMAAAGRRNRDMRSRSEEHTSELQSQSNLVCRLLLEKKKNQQKRVESAREYPASEVSQHIQPGVISAA